MTNNNFTTLVGFFLSMSTPTTSESVVCDRSGVLKYDGTKISSSSTSTNINIATCFSISNTFGENNNTGSRGIFLTLGTDDTPPTKSDLKLGNSVEDFVWLSGSRFTGSATNSNDLLMFNSVVNYRGSSPITIREMGLNCQLGGRFLLARETIEPLVINPDDTYSFVMRIK